MIIKSILDTDLYKLTMGFAVVKNFPYQKVRYKFTDRNNISFPDNFDKDVMDEVKNMESLFLTQLEKTWVTRNLGKFLPPTYIDFLSGYRFDSSEVDVYLDDDNKLHIDIEGFWYRTILWEVPLMAIISELYFQKTGQIIDIFDNNIVLKDRNKLQKMTEHNAFFADFGTRRRYSFKNQEKIVSLYKDCPIFTGTSNVFLAYKYNIKCTGTMAHEWFMVHAALFGYKMSNKLSLDNWVNTYEGSLGIALSDTYTSDVFFKSFDMKQSKLFDGVRHDSGDPFEFTDKVINHYKSMGIDPMSKTIIFSDGLNTDLATEIKEYCVGRIKSAFGIGTHLTNDMGVKPLNMVIKISEVLFNDDWIPAVKLSDNKGKNTGDKDEVELCKKILNIR